MMEAVKPPGPPPFKLPPLSNPFFFQLMPTVGAGIGIGCGVGIGFGKQVPFSSIPGLDGIGAGIQQVGHQLRGVRNVVKKGLAKTGQKNLDAGLGCGVGIGYGFGVGLFLKPGVGEGIVEIGKGYLEYGKEQLQARYGHLLPKPAVSEEERKAEDGEAGSSSLKAPSNESGRGSGNTLGKPASNSQAGFSMPGAKGEAGDRGEPSGAYKAHVAPAGVTRGGLDGVSMTEKAVSENEGDTKSTTSASKDHKKRGLEGGGSQPSKKGPQVVRDKEIDRLQFENDLLRETLRQREQLQDLRGEVDALREALGSQVTVSSQKGAAGQCADAHVGHMCFKCQQVLRRRR